MGKKYGETRVLNHAFTWVSLTTNKKVSQFWWIYIKTKKWRETSYKTNSAQIHVEFVVAVINVAIVFSFDKRITELKIEKWIWPAFRMKCCIKIGTIAFIWSVRLHWSDSERALRDIQLNVGLPGYNLGFWQNISSTSYPYCWGGFILK